MEVELYPVLNNCFVTARLIYAGMIVELLFEAIKELCKLY